MITLTATRRSFALSRLAVALLISLLLGLPLALHLPQLSSLYPGSSSASTWGKLPLSFVPNVGQFDSAVHMQTRSMGGALSFATDGMVLDLPPVRSSADHNAATRPLKVRLQFLGADSTTTIDASSQLPGVVSYYNGNDAAYWRTNVPTYGVLSYHRLYPGVDLHYDGTDGQLKGTYLLAAGADPNAIRWHYVGATALQIDNTGNLIIGLPDAHPSLTEHAPLAWQMVGGHRVPVVARYALAADQTIGFVLGNYDPALPLTIDPLLTYSTYLGGNNGDFGYGIALDGSGNSYITGKTFSTNFPGASGMNTGSADIFVAKLNPQGSALVYSTYLGGTGADAGLALAIDAGGNAYLTGSTDSADFPLRNALVSTQPTATDAVVVKLDAAGRLNYSTYFGITVDDVGKNIAVDSAGNAYVTGRRYGGASYDVSLTKFSADGSGLLYDVNFGGSFNDAGTAIAVDAAGNAYVTGITDVPGVNDFPVTSTAIQPQCGGGSRGCGQDAFVSVINADATHLLYSTYLGGSRDETARGITVDASGNIYVVGDTYSSDFPTRSAFQATCPDGADQNGNCSQQGFVTKLNSDGTAFIYSSYLAGPDRNDFDGARAIAADAAGNAYVTGYTNSQNFPLRNPLQTSPGGGFCDVGGSERYCEDAFVVQFAADGTVPFSTYLGGNGDDYGYAIAADNAGNAYLTGSTLAANFPVTTGVLQPTKSLQEDAFVVKIVSGNPPPTGQYTVYMPLVRR